jgi:cytochrome c oxidase subunit II
MFPFSPHSPQAHAIVSLFNATLVLAAIVFVTVSGLVSYSLLRYRARGNPNEPPQIAGSRKLEMIWTVVPLMLVIALFIITVRTTAFIDAPLHPGQTPDLVITGHQWWWEARYPNGAITASEIHIPYGRRLLAQIESADVIHDFWVPQLARKMDAVPGLASYIWLEADAIGAYQGSCAEFCGAQHAWMRLVVVAETEQNFSAWLKRQSEPAAAPTGAEAAEGARLFQQMKCGDCHAISGTSSARSGTGAAGPRGPDLTHLASRQYLGSGISPNTPPNLAQWITDPQSTKPGNRMSNPNLSSQEAQALLAYLETLQ